MAKIDDRISKLRAQLQAAENRRTTQARKDETRLKVLLGAFILHQVQTRDAPVAESLRTLLEGEMPKFLVRERDVEFWTRMAPALTVPAGPDQPSAERP